MNERDTELAVLSLEGQGDEWDALREIDFTYFVNNPMASGVCRVFGLGLPDSVLGGEAGGLISGRTCRISAFL